MFELYRSPRTGDLLMDVPKTKSWRELMHYTADKDYWKARARAMWQQPVVNVNVGTHVEEGSWSHFTVSN